MRSPPIMKNTGLVIAETFRALTDAVPACLVRNHGFAGKSCESAVYHAAVLEYCAHMAYVTESLGTPEPVPDYLLDRIIGESTVKMPITGNHKHRTDDG